MIKLISNTVPAYFGDEKVPDFRPHATITSEIPPNLDPQEVLDSIDIKEPPNVVFTSMVIGFVPKLALRFCLSIADVNHT